MEGEREGWRYDGGVVGGRETGGGRIEGWWVGERGMEVGWRGGGGERGMEVGWRGGGGERGMEVGWRGGGWEREGWR